VGRDASALHRDPDLLGHVYVGPYLVRGIDTQLVVVDRAGVAGYLLSADDTEAFEDWAEESWWPALRTRYPLRRDGSRDDELIRQIHEPPRTPDGLVEAYPAHLHIDLMDRARGQGLGRALIERLLAELRSRGVVGLHLWVDAANENAIGFYRRLGFEELRREQRGILLGQTLR
jgi:ribosomal protein S18 acetylase RimI-like enzyme